jgi:hypothetical protein
MGVVYEPTRRFLDTDDEVVQELHVSLLVVAQLQNFREQGEEAHGARGIVERLAYSHT